MNNQEDYLKYSKKYREILDSSIAKEFMELDIIKEMEEDDEKLFYSYFKLAKIKMFQSSLCLTLNNICVHFTSQPDKTYLNDTRKHCFECLDYLEKIGTKFLDVPFSDYEGQIAHIQEITVAERLQFFKKLGFLIDGIKIAYGENSKWKWIFVEAEGRFTTVFKNFLDIKELMIAMTNPSYENYRAWVSYDQMVKAEMSTIADKYRQKYEMFSKKPEDFSMATNFLLALKRYCVITGDSKDMDNLNKKIEVWKAKLEKDIKQSKSQ